MLPESEFSDLNEDVSYPLDSLEGMDPNSNLPPIGFRSGWDSAPENDEQKDFPSPEPACAGRGESFCPDEDDKPEVAAPRTISRLKTLGFASAISFLTFTLALYGVILIQRSLELSRSRNELKVSLEKLGSSLTGLDVNLTAIASKSTLPDLSLPERLSRREKIGQTGKTEAIRSTQILAGLTEILNRSVVKSLTPTAGDVFNQSRVFSLSAEDYTSESYKTFSYLQLTYATDNRLATLSLRLAELSSKALTGENINPSQLKGISGEISKTKDDLTVAGKDLPYALGAVAEKNLRLVTGFETAVTAAKRASDLQDRQALSNIIETTGTQLNSLWQSRENDEEAFWNSNRTLKRYLYLKPDLDKILQLLQKS